MREILFRGKREDNGEWVEGFYLYTEENTHPVIIDMKCRSHIIIPETVGQFTGLTDKNGKSIFEGDIVRLTFSGAVGKIICDINYSIYFNLFGRVVDKLLTDYHCEDIEVIGNETDNPELLKGE